MPSLTAAPNWGTQWATAPRFRGIRFRVIISDRKHNDCDGFSACLPRDRRRAGLCDRCDCQGDARCPQGRFIRAVAHSGGNWGESKGVPKRTVGLRCTICNHPARPQIDLAIATGLSKRAIAERFSVSPDAVWRHGQSHLTPELRAAVATKLLQRDGDMRRVLLEEGTGVVEALKAIRGPLFGLFLVAIDAGDSKAAAALAARLHESLALAAKLTGELAPQAGVTVTNILLSPDFQRLRAELMRVLARHPEVQAEVAAVFRRAGMRAAAEMAAQAPDVIEAQRAEGYRAV